MSGKKKFTSDQSTKVRLANGRYAYVADSPYRKGTLAYRFAESDKKFLGKVPSEEHVESNQSTSTPIRETREPEHLEDS